MTKEQLEWQLQFYQDRLTENPGDGMYMDYIRNTVDQLAALANKENVE